MSENGQHNENAYEVRPRSVEEVVEWCRILAEASAIWPISGLPERHYPPSTPAETRAWMSVWSYGEKRRQGFKDHPAWLRLPDVQAGLKRVVERREWGRGRESFVMLFGRRALAHHAPWIAGYLGDPELAATAVWTLRRMRVPGYADAVRPFLEHEKAWIRREARGYMRWA